MNEQSLVDLMARAAERVPESPAPIRDVLARGRARRRRTRRTVAVGVAAAVVLGAGIGVGLARGGGSSGVDRPAGPLPAPPAGMKWSGIGSTVFAVPKSFTMEPGVYCGTSGDGSAYDGHATLDITQWHVVAGCLAPNLLERPPLPETDDVDFAVDPTGGVHASLSLPHPVAGFGAGELHASRTTLPAGWKAVPAGVPTEGIGAPTVATEVAALKAAGFRTRVEETIYWSGPRVTTSPEIGAPARVGSVVTVHRALAAPASAGLGGTLVESGGLPANALRPARGWVHVRGGTIDEYVYTNRQGRWSIPYLPPGTYTITGDWDMRVNGRAVGESCAAPHPVRARLEEFGATGDIDVYCDNPMY